MVPRRRRPEGDRVRALVDVPSEDSASPRDPKSQSRLRRRLLLLLAAPAKGAYTCVGRLAPVRTRVSGEGGARVDFHLVDAPVLRERDPEAFSRLVDVGRKVSSPSASRFSPTL